MSTAMTVRDVMTSPAIAVTPETTFEELVELFLSKDISGVPVVDDDGAVLGVVTEADLMAQEAYGDHPRRPLGLVGAYLRGHDPQWVRKASAHRAATLMTGAVDTTSPDAAVTDAARRMLESHHKRLPVVEHGRLVGIVTRHDVVRGLSSSPA